ncbi:hypothetical protein SBBP1_510002 [Burkholderiales bacterium]|nr:hypothetical protein SBBP1_510002 [Burkholderiales bacterium]
MSLSELETVIEVAFGRRPRRSPLTGFAIDALREPASQVWVVCDEMHPLSEPRRAVRDKT